jgi:hypothetical protein
MTISFAAIVSLIAQERVGRRLGSILLWPMLAIGIASLLVWLWIDDLRLYFWDQFFPAVALIALFALFPAGTRTRIIGSLPPAYTRWPKCSSLPTTLYIRLVIIPYPAFGAGVSFRWRPIEDSGLFVNGVLNDMNGNPSQGSLNWSHLQIGQLFAGIEVGKQWQRENGEYDQLALDVFNAGTRSIFSPNTTPNKAGGGFKILGEKQWGPIVGFANYTFNTAKGGGISTTFSNNTAVAGVALLRPFGIVGEAAVAGMWSLPFKDLLPGVGQRAQYGMETYWKIGLTPNTTVTPGIQLIFDPSFNPRVNFIAIPDVKFRIAI